jgi:hypothetical protein
MMGDERIDDLIAASSVGAGLADIKARGIDAHLVDLDAEMCPHPKIVPINKDWARCTTCGDSTFPLSAFASGEDVAPKKKRKKSASPTSFTLKECAKRGWIAGVVERFVRFPPPGHKVDLFGVIDIVAIAPSASPAMPSLKPGATIGIQATTNTGGQHSKHRMKILAEPRARAWVEAGNRLELWSWSKRVVRNRDGSKAKRPSWTLRVETYEDMVAAQDDRKGA